jgi:hypothetical protein
MKSGSGRYRRAITSYATGTCRICREVKGGRIPQLPAGVTPVAETIPGGVVLRPGEGPAPFVCADCEQRQRDGQVALLPGQVIKVEVDGHWRSGLFVRAGEPLEAETVQDARLEGGARLRDVAFVRVPGWDGDQTVPYQRIRLPG